MIYPRSPDVAHRQDLAVFGCSSTVCDPCRCRKRVVTVRPSPFSAIPLSNISDERRHFTGKETHNEIKKLSQNQRQGWKQRGVPPENINHRGTVLPKDGQSTAAKSTRNVSMCFSKA